MIIITINIIIIIKLNHTDTESQNLGQIVQPYEQAQQTCICFLITFWLTITISVRIIFPLNRAVLVFS